MFELLAGLIDTANPEAASDCSVAPEMAAVELSVSTVLLTVFCACAWFIHALPFHTNDSPVFALVIVTSPKLFKLAADILASALVFVK